MDKQTLAIVAAAILVTGCVVWAMWPTASKVEHETNQEDVTVLYKRVAAMELKIERLEVELAGLKRQPQERSRPAPKVAATTTSRKSGSPTNAPTTAHDVQATETENAPTPTSDNPSALEPTQEAEVREKLSEMVRDELEIEREERRIRRETRMLKRTKEDAKLFAQSIGLEEDDAAQYSDLLIKERTAILGMWQKAREEGGDFKAVREKTIAAREETDKEVADLLDEEQLETYNAKREGEANLWRGR